jgi:hypothetical protein
MILFITYQDGKSLGEIMHKLSENESRKKFKLKEKIIGIAYKISVLVLVVFFIVEECLLLSGASRALFNDFQDADVVKYVIIIIILSSVGITLLLLLKYKYNYVYVEKKN